MRLFAFIVALMLLGGSADPQHGWLITLVVVTGIAALRPRYWNWLHVRPALDLRLASFVLAILLLAGVIDPTRDWLIVLSVVTGLALVIPGGFNIDPFGFDERPDRVTRKWQRRADQWQRRSARSSERADRDWDRWERRMDDRRMRSTDGWGDDWS
jgi:hypothetical protein